MNKKIVTRFAPSPTGVLHIGSARTALFNYLAAKSLGGEMLLRIEDTDTERSKPEFEENILDGLKWLGIIHDGEVVRQSRRSDIYKKYTQDLLDSGAAYISEEEKDGKPSTVIRFKNPNKTITFTDTLRGEVTFDTTDLNDFVIARDVEHPLYHLAVVIDDHEMRVNHVIRGEDGISNTPRQILIQEAIGAKRPAYTHIPLVLGTDKSKLSKRHGATSITDFQEKGYLPEAIINHIALLGWSPDELLRQEEEEFFVMIQLVEHFSLDRVQKGGAVFNYEKLDFLNRKHLQKLPPKELVRLATEHIPSEIKDFAGYTPERLLKVLPVVLERVYVLSDITKMHEAGELAYFFTPPDYASEALLWKKDPDPAHAKEHLEKVISLLEPLVEKSFTEETIKGAIWDYASEVGRGDVLWPMRYALSGQDKSPDPFILADILGKEEATQRLFTAIAKL